MLTLTAQGNAKFQNFPPARGLEGATHPSPSTNSPPQPSTPFGGLLQVPARYRYGKLVEQVVVFKMLSCPDGGKKIEKMK